MAEKVYITPAGARKLRQELTELWRETRPKITRQVSEAAALGDRSENADYIYGKKRLREIDRRIRYLTRQLDNLEVVDRPPQDTGRVYFGAWVRLQDSDGLITQVRIVGTDEFNPKIGWISLKSPVAKSLLGKQKGAKAEVALPTGISRWRILDISYSPFD